MAELARRLVTVDAAPALRAAGLSDVGRQRTVNEDRCHVDPARGIFIVVDGVGGQAAGGRAADIALRMLRQRLERPTGTAVARVREAITIANNEIFHEARGRPDFTGMACVLTVAVIEAGRLVIGHVGDTRLYLFHRGEARKLTPDHSPVGEREDARELSEFEAMRHPRRHEVFRDVGSTVHQLTDPDFIHLSDVAFPTDAALLICSDGLTDLVPLEAIRRTVHDGAGQPDRVVSALVRAANDAGGRDNVTAVYAEGTHFAVPASLPLAPGVVERSHVRRRRLWRWLAVLLVAVLLGTGWWAWRTGRLPGGPAVVLAPQTPGAIVVRPGESLADALSRAEPGYSLVVEPGEYVERLTLKDHVRIISRVPRAATIRLPVGSTPDEAAVVAAGVIGAELSGFRIVGAHDAPLGVGVVVRESDVRLVDLDITGAGTAALAFGVGADATLIGSVIHDNPGAAMVVAPGATPRIAHSSFAANGSGVDVAGPFVFEAGARPVFDGNIFHDVTPRAFTALEPEASESVSTSNSFVSMSQGRRQAPAESR